MQSQTFFQCKYYCSHLRSVSICCKVFATVVVMIQINYVSLHHILVYIFLNLYFALSSEVWVQHRDCKKMVKEGWESFSFLQYSLVRTNYKKHYSTSHGTLVSLLHKEKYLGPRLKASLHKAWICKRPNAPCVKWGAFARRGN